MKATTWVTMAVDFLNDAAEYGHNDCGSVSDLRAEGLTEENAQEWAETLSDSVFTFLKSGKGYSTMRGEAKKLLALFNTLEHPVPMK